MLTGKTNQLSLIGNGAHSLNYNICHPVIKIPKYSSYNPVKTKNLLNTAYFNKLDTVVKLNNLGMSFTTLKF
jgi:hypothetical protein